MTIADLHRVDEVLVKVVDLLDHPAVELTADGYGVEHRQVLDEITETNPVGVRADGRGNMADSVYWSTGRPIESWPLP